MTTARATLTAPARFPTLIDLVRPADASASRVFDVAAILVASLFVAAAAQLSIPTPWGVPFVCSDIAALLVGVALGPWRGAAALFVYMMQGLMGLPVFAHGTAGFPPVTFGFILGFIPAAGLAGLLAQRGWDRSPVRLSAALALSQIVIYIGGVAWLSLAALQGVANAPSATFGAIMMAGVVPFLPVAAVKIAVAVALVPAAWRLIGRTR